MNNPQSESDIAAHSRGRSERGRRTAGPFFFDSPHGPLFGYLHSPEPPRGRDLGVVLCQPLAQEYILSHRSLRRLAQLLAAAGVPTFRFDYFGCGDSPGDLPDARVERWLADIDAAIGELVDRSGCTRVCLGGLRLGGNLALSRGLTDPRVDSLVLWDPVVEMSGYLGSDSSTALEGFEVGKELMEDLQRMDLASCAEGGWARVLLIQTEGESSGSAVVARLEAAGSTVEHRPRAGTAVWRQDINRIVVPHALLQSIVAWVTQP